MLLLTNIWKKFGDGNSKLKLYLLIANTLLAKNLFVILFKTGIINYEKGGGEKK